MEVEERFWVKVSWNIHDDQCWPWIACKDQDGYGLFKFCGSQRRAHRFAYELEVGLIPVGLTLDHLCRNRSCVRPDHLEPVTQKVNSLRGNGVGARNARRVSCFRCGGPYSRWSSGRRYCPPCKREATKLGIRRLRARRRGDYS